MPTTVKTRKPRADKRYQLLEVTDLTGGVDLRRSQTLLGPDRARVLKNYSLEEPGALVVRPGYTAFTTSALGASRCQGGQRVYTAGTAFTLVAWDGHVYRPTDAGVWGSTVGGGLSSAAQVYFPYDRDLVAWMDGTNRPRKSTDGTAWTLMGIDAPSSAAVLSSLSTGALLANEYEVAYSYKDRGLAHEGNISSGSTYTMGSTGSLHAVASPSTDAQADAYVWYARNVTAGETVLRKYSSGAASTIRITSSNWGGNDEAPTDHTPPTACAFGVVWKNRWWAKDAVVGNRLKFTQLFQPQSWPGLFYIDIPFERGDDIAAVVPQGDTLIVFGQSKVFLIIGQTSLDFEVRPSAGAQAGCLGPRAAAAVEQGVLHASAEGVFLFDGATDRLLTLDIDPAWRDLIQNTAPAELEKVAMVYHFMRKELRIRAPRVYPRATVGEWILNLDRTRQNETPAWSDTDRAIAFYMLWDGNEAATGSRGQLVTAADTNAQLFTEATGTTANSSNMSAEYEGPALALGLHRARVIDVRGEYEPHGGSFAVETVIDGVSQGSQSVSIGSGLAVYGTAVYGTAVYGGSGRRMFVKELPLAAEGRTIVQKTVYSGQERFRHFTYAYGITPETAPRGFGD